MTDLAAHLERLGLEQYLDALEGEGFDSWETLLDIQESDLEALGVKLGHRRKLQRAIADFRGFSYDRLLGSPGQDSSTPDAARHGEGSPAVPPSTPAAPPTEAKRRYRRHPRPDENAPEKPPSAYVLFSNRVRESVKEDNLSFTEIAKLVGEKWQKLDHGQKEPFETRAMAMKEQYNIQLSAYKKTDAYREYVQYLADFKAKHNHENKRPRLDAQSSGGSISAASIDPTELALPASIPYAAESTGSLSASSFAGSLPHPGGALSGTSSATAAAAAAAVAAAATTTAAMTTTSLPNLSASLGSGAVTAAPRSSSPTWSHYGRDRRPPPPPLQSTHSSLSDDSVSARTDTQDTLSRTATLSLHTPPTVTPPLSSRLEPGGLPDPFARSSRASAALVPQTQPVPATDHFRERSADAPRPVAPQTAPTAMSVPSLLGSDRILDITRGHVQRVLPPPRLPPAPALQSPPAYTSGMLPMGPPPHMIDSTTGPLPYHLGPGSRGVDSKDNDAANTLAGLARRPDAESSERHARRH